MFAISCIEQTRATGERTMPNVVYLDVNGTTPVDLRVRDAIVEHLDQGDSVQPGFGNPSSSHAYGAKPREAVSSSRQLVCKLLGIDTSGECKPADLLTFTSGGTESITWVARSLAKDSYDRDPREGCHFVVSALEHVAVLATIEAICAESRGLNTVSVAQSGCDGVVLPDTIINAIKPNTKGVFVMLANNETGAIQPVAQTIRRIRALPEGGRIAVHVDASQAFGKIPVSIEHLGCDYLTLAGHKCYSTKGVGALYHRHGVRLGGPASSMLASLPPAGEREQVPLRPLFFGGGQEGGRRAGTENVALIAGLGRAAEIAATELAKDVWHSRRLRAALLGGLTAGLQGTVSGSQSSGSISIDDAAHCSAIKGV